MKKMESMMKMKLLKIQRQEDKLKRNLRREINLIYLPPKWMIILWMISLQKKSDREIEKKQSSSSNKINKLMNVDILMLKR